MQSRPSYATATRFREAFGRNITDFWHPLYGFDIVHFDELMQKKFGYIEDGKTSCADFVKQKWGQEMQDMILKLIGG